MPPESRIACAILNSARLSNRILERVGIFRLTQVQEINMNRSVIGRFGLAYGLVLAIGLATAPIAFAQSSTTNTTVSPDGSAASTTTTTTPAVTPTTSSSSTTTVVAPDSSGGTTTSSTTTKTP